MGPGDEIPQAVLRHRDRDSQAAHSPGQAALLVRNDLLGIKRCCTPQDSAVKFLQGILIYPKISLPKRTGMATQRSCSLHSQVKAEVRRSFITTTVRERPRSHHKGATCRVRTGDHGPTVSSSMPLPTWTRH